MPPKPMFLCAVVGPTASGKTGLSIELAKRNQGEIISFDSMQIYREAPIATAVPTKEERQGIPHHLLEFANCNETFSVAKYLELAHNAVQVVINKGKLPVLVGGTGLYYSSLVDNIQFQTQDEEHFSVRKDLEQRAQSEGIEALYRELQTIDPKAAQKIHINNRVRVIRALEIYYATGKTLSEQEALSRSVPSPYLPCVIGLNYRNRDTLYQRINLRVFQMLEAGLEREVEALYHNHPNGTILQAIGVKEFAPYFAGKCSLEQVVETIQQESRRYAKRQLTWFRRDPRVHWLYPDDYTNPQQLLEEAQQILEKEKMRWIKEG